MKSIIKIRKSKYFTFYLNYKFEYISKNKKS